MIKVSQEFHILSKDAINGQYSNPFFKDQFPVERRLYALITNSHDDFETRLRKEGARWIILKSKDRGSVRGSHNNRYLTREEAVDKIQKFLRISRGREVIAHFVYKLYLAYELTLRISFPGLLIRCLSARSLESIANPGRVSPALISAQSGKARSSSLSKSCNT